MTTGTGIVGIAMVGLLAASLSSSIIAQSLPASPGPSATPRLPAASSSIAGPCPLSATSSLSPSMPVESSEPAATPVAPTRSHAPMPLPASPAASASAVPFGSSGPSGVPSPGPDRAAARAAIVAYLGHLRHDRYRAAWRMLSEDARTHWGTFAAFASGQWEVNHIDRITDDPTYLCVWVSPGDGTRRDWRGADLGRAWVVDVTHGPGHEMGANVYVVAPMADGAWRVWLVR